MIIGLMACDPKGCIGKDGGLPWDCAQEMNHFYRMTLHKTMVMGRKTFESMPPAIFDQREAVVLSRTKRPSVLNSQVAFVTSIEEYLEYKDLSYHYMVGGAEIAHLFLEHGLLDQFLLSVMDKEYPGDTYLDLQKLNVFDTEISTQYEEFILKDLRKPVELKYTTYG